MAKPDLLKRDPILCNLQIIDHVFLPHDKVKKIHKIGSLLSKSGSAIQFLFKFCFRNHDYNVKVVRDLRVQFSVLAKVANNEHVDLILCATVLSPVLHFAVHNNTQIRIVIIFSKRHFAIHSDTQIRIQYYRRVQVC